MEELRGSTIVPMAEREILLLEYCPVENILSIGVSSFLPTEPRDDMCISREHGNIACVIRNYQLDFVYNDS